jgi:hypothetical protein
VREARTSRAAASSDEEKIAGRIVEYGTAVEKANRSMPLVGSLVDTQ